MTLNTGIKLLKGAALLCTLGSWAVEMLIDEKTELKNQVIMKRMIDKSVEKKLAEDLTEMKIKKFLESVEA